MKEENYWGGGADEGGGGERGEKKRTEDDGGNGNQYSYRFWLKKFVKNVFAMMNIPLQYAIIGRKGKKGRGGAW